MDKSNEPWNKCDDVTRRHNMDLRERVGLKLVDWEDLPYLSGFEARDHLMRLLGDYIDHYDFLVHQYTDGGVINAQLNRLLGPYGYVIYKAMKAKQS